MTLSLGPSLSFPCRAESPHFLCSFIRSRSQFLYFLLLAFPSAFFLPDLQGFWSGYAVHILGTDSLMGILTLQSPISHCPRGFSRFSIKFSRVILFHPGPPNSDLAPEVSYVGTYCSWHLLVSGVTSGSLQ